MSGPCSVTKDHHLHPLTFINAGTDAPPFELAVRVHVHKRLLSLSTAATAGQLSISATEYVYDGYRQTSCISSLDDDDDLDSVTFDILGSFPVDIDLYEIYGEKIFSDTRDLLETAGEMNLRVEANICLWVDILDEEVELVFAERMSMEDAEAVRTRVRLEVDPEAVLKEKVWAGTDEEDKCSVCLEEFVKGERVASMPCAHCFHKDCIAEWLTQGSNTCPVCRYIVN